MTGKKLIAGCCIVGAAILLAGAYSPQSDGRNAVLVEEVYVVKSGDTLWNIAETYVAKNTGISSSTRAASRSLTRGSSNAMG